MAPDRRPTESTAEMDAGERAFWEEISDLQEVIWAFEGSERANRIVRGHYFHRMTQFLGAARGASLLDVGCGTGWVGQWLAQRGAHVIGVDSAERALAVARATARARGLEDRTEYTSEDLRALLSAGRSFDGAVLHAVLHHLSHREIEALLATLSRLLKPGGRLFVYEHVVFRRDPTHPVARLARGSQYLLRVVHDVTFARLKRRGLINEAYVERMSAAGVWSAEHHAVGSSPKEFPFEEGELEAALSPYFEVRRTYLCTVMNYFFGQLAMLCTSPRVRSVLLGTLARGATLHDRLMCATSLARYLDPSRRYIGWPFLAVEASRRP